MSFTITARIFQTNANAFFNVVEQAAFVSSTWSEKNGAHVLTMDNSGTSGSLRFQDEDTGEFFLVALGVHNYARWCDIVPDLDAASTSTTTLPQYYNGSSPLASQREKTMSVFAVKSTSGLNYEVNYTVPTGNQLEANIIIF